MVKLKQELIDKLVQLPESGKGFQYCEILLSPITTDFRSWLPVLVTNYDTLPNVIGTNTEDIIDVRLLKNKL